MRIFIFMLMSLALLAQGSLAQDKSLQERLSAAREKGDVPAMGVLVIRDYEITGVAVDGLRRLGGTARVTAEDRWHLGSNAKAMTATLLLILEQEGIVGRETTFAEAFPDLAEDMHADYRAVTLGQALSHTAGLPANMPTLELIGYRNSDRPVRAQRSREMRRVLTNAPDKAPGSTFQYSNIGYTLVGAAMEGATDTPFEVLIEERLFQPLGIDSYGVGAPGEPKTGSQTAEQPRGHRAGLFGRSAVEPGKSADNPLMMAPAGTLHMSLRDWAAFALDHLHGGAGRSALLPREAYQALHTPPMIAGERGNYALGWGLVGGTVEAPVLQHAGSNTMWFALIRLDPQSGDGVLLVANDASEETIAVMRELLAELWSVR